jgi:hypothetical protein
MRDSEVYTLGRRQLRRVFVQDGGPGDPMPTLRQLGFTCFKSPREMLVELRKHVMLKMIRQAHEAELAEPGEPPTSAIVGTPEW